MSSTFIVFMIVISILWEFDYLSFLISSTHTCTIYPCSRYTHLVILQRLLPSTSTFSGVITLCHFWWVICFSSLKSLSSESRDEILFRGEGCDSSCTCNVRYIFVSVKSVYVSVKLAYVCVKLLKNLKCKSSWHVYPIIMTSLSRHHDIS
jgi:hypothetical protein